MGSRRKRRHHHNPRSYLAHFTDTAKADGKLYEHDLVLDGRRHRTADSCGYMKDLYRVLEEGLEPDGVESWLGDSRDGPGIAVVREIISRQVVPAPGSFDFRDLMQFLSIAGFRSPAFRSIVTTWTQDASEAGRQNEFVRQMLLNADPGPQFAGRILDASWWLPSGPRPSNSRRLAELYPEPAPDPWLGVDSDVPVHSLDRLPHHGKAYSDSRGGLRGV